MLTKASFSCCLKLEGASSLKPFFFQRSQGLSDDATLLLVIHYKTVLQLQDSKKDKTTILVQVNLNL